MPDSFHIQRSGQTAYDRYPNLFAATRTLSQNFGMVAPRILSFGCSTGEEVSTLATKYYPQSRILGLDINEASLAVARRIHHVENRTTFELSSPETIERNGPYDIIFALSVLCRWPDGADIDDLNDLFTFADFEAIIGLLDNSLIRGGILVLNGCNYQFLDTGVSERYGAVLGSVMNNGFVSRFDRDGHKQMNHAGSDSIYVKMEMSGSIPKTGFLNRRIMYATGAVIGTLSTSRP